MVINLACLDFEQLDNPRLSAELTQRDCIQGSARPRSVATTTAGRRSLWLYRSINLAQLLWELSGQVLLTVGSKAQGMLKSRRRGEMLCI